MGDVLAFQPLLQYWLQLDQPTDSVPSTPVGVESPQGTISVCLQKILDGFESVQYFLSACFVLENSVAEYPNIFGLFFNPWMV